MLYWCTSYLRHQKWQLRLFEFHCWGLLIFAYVDMGVHIHTRSHMCGCLSVGNRRCCQVSFFKISHFIWGLWMSLELTSLTSLGCQAWPRDPFWLYLMALMSSHLFNGGSGDLTFVPQACTQAFCPLTLIHLLVGMWGERIVCFSFAKNLVPDTSSWGFLFFKTLPFL